MRALLSANERRLLRRLSVCDHGWDLAAAVAVTAEAPSLDGIDLLALLASLHDHSLIDVVGRIQGAPRFTMLATVRAFARGQLDAEGETAEAERRYAAHIAALEGTPLTHRAPAGLTEREIEVLQLVAGGLGNPHIARRLVISTRTVHAHLRSIFSKLGVNSRSAATRLAVEHGLVSPARGESRSLFDPHAPLSDR